MWLWSLITSRIDVRDALTAFGALALAYGAGRVDPALGWSVLGLTVLYITLWHGIVIARARRTEE